MHGYKSVGPPKASGSHGKKTKQKPQFWKGSEQSADSKKMMIDRIKELKQSRCAKQK